MRFSPDGRTRLQLVIRWRPRLVVYTRAEPVTVRRPTPAQAEARLRFAEVARLARILTPEQVADLVGGEVVEVDGKRWVRLPNGKILPPQNALVWWYMSGWRSPRTRVFELPRWLTEVAKSYAPLPLRLARVLPAKS